MTPDDRSAKLAEYHRKRDFSRTPEPARGRTRSKKPRFVIQKHAATALHYDFRLEVAGVLKSWAVPKGPSTDPRDKRLAMPTEDHPIGYLDFEGVIPAGQYGGGPVIVWDIGHYENITERNGEPVSMEDGLDAGHVSVWLEGRKLEGGYALTRVDMKGREKWILVKRRDEAADARRNPVSTQPESVLSGLTIEQMRETRA